MVKIQSKHETEVNTPFPGGKLDWKPGEGKDIQDQELAAKLLEQKGFEQVKETAQPAKKAKKGGK